MLLADWFDAVRHGRLDEVANIFARQGELGYFDIACTDEFDNCALYYACHYGHTDLIQFLVDKGARDDASRRCWRNALCRHTLPKVLRKKMPMESSEGFKQPKELQHFSKEQWATKNTENKHRREKLGISRAVAPACMDTCSTICIRNLKWTYEMEMFFNALANNTVDYRLDMRKCKLGESVGCRDMLARSLKANNTLTDIFLHLNELGDIGVELLFDNIQRNVRKMNLCTNNITDSGCIPIANFLCCPTRCQLVALDLNRNNIGSPGCIHIAEALKNPLQSTLENLSIMDNRVGTEGALAVFGAFQKNLALQKINLKGNPIDDVTVLGKIDKVNKRRKKEADAQKSNPLEDEKCHWYELFNEVAGAA